MLEKWGGRDALLKKYLALKAEPPPPHQIWQRILIELEVGLKVDAPSIAKVPQQGPIILVANHPYGIVDGVACCYLASLLRKKFSILANSVLCNDPLIEDFVLPVDFNESKDALKTNIETKSEALKRLSRQEAIVIFPGGGVSTAKGFNGQVTDLPWKRFVIKLVVQSNATIIPIFIEGQNSKLFQFVSQFSMNLRLGLFMRETLRMRGKDLKLHIGHPIPPEEIIIKKDRDTALSWLREQVYALDPRRSNELQE